MTLYDVSLRQAWDVPGIAARKWSNIFYVEAASAIAAASAIGLAWSSFLRGAAHERVFAYEVYATDQNPLTTDFVTLAIPAADQRGLIVTPVGGDPYLAKTAIAVELLVPGSRPMRKFWRPVLYENEIISGVTVLSSIENAIRDAFADMLAGFSGLRDPDGQVLSTVGTIRLTTREFGRESTNLVPSGPSLG